MLFSSLQVLYEPTDDLPLRRVTVHSSLRIMFDTAKESVVRFYNRLKYWVLLFLDFIYFSYYLIILVVNAKLNENFSNVLMLVSICNDFKSNCFIVSKT